MTSGERIARLERALAESTYLTHGPRGLPTLTRQAPALAEIFSEYLTNTEPVDETFVGRRETADRIPDETRREP